MLARAQADLSWPSDEVLFNPSGSGAAVIADLARAKIQQRVNLLEGGKNARVGILTLDPSSRSTQAPIALVCEFNETIPLTTLRELHILSWNFSRTPLLVTLEPHRIRAFSCCQQPEREISSENQLRAEIVEAEYRTDQDKSLAEKASAALHWINLSCGAFQRRYPERFDRRFAADNLLLDNLQVVREKLHDNSLDFDLIHDLLARLIFIQFLFQRQDSSGTPALNANYLRKLYEQKILSKQHTDLGDILGHRSDTYAIFRYLNDRFNGDLFPGKADTEKERDKEWRKEMKVVRKEHLDLLRTFVTGEMQIRNGQYALWPLYSFDTIPLEFISSIYETFVTKRTGTVYTPVHLVDFILDGVLPWEGKEWDLRVLDPACGSGIFLVRVFQRLAHRWKNAHPGVPLRTDILKKLLKDNLTGVDIDQHAIRVASFSLYLAMCDELDPRHYWQQIQFPKLRGNNLITTDFFSEKTKGLNTEKDLASYDLIVGNPPWGKNQIKEISKEFDSDAASEWSKRYSWPISYGDPALLFVAKSLRLVKPEGAVSLLQPTQTLLLNQSGPAVEQRRNLITQHRIVEVVNLSSLRFGLFKKAIGPSSVITVKPEHPNQDYSITYIVVKPGSDSDNDYRFVIDSYDVHEICSSDVENDALPWTALTWGGPRDLSLIRNLSRFPSISKYEKDGKIKTRRGVIRGNRKKLQLKIIGRRFFSDYDFPEESLLYLDAKRIPINQDPETDAGASTDLIPFRSPQMLIKRSWRREAGRFRAALITNNQKGVLCSDSYITVSAIGKDNMALESCCLALNSKLATYYLLLSSAQFSNYRETTNVNELLSVPCPIPKKVNLLSIKSFGDLDEEVYEEFGLKNSERVLIEDLFDITLQYFKGGESSIARKSTNRLGCSDDADLMKYLEWFLRVLNSTFGKENSICATLFEEHGNNWLPVRLVAIHLDWPNQKLISVEPLDQEKVVDKLTGLYQHLSGSPGKGPVGYKRVARIFDSYSYEGKSIPTIFIAKPDEKRYWTRSLAMRDADEIVSEILLWNNQKKKGDA